MTIGSHQRAVGRSQVHLTPRWILDRLGTFDLDPCASMPRPWRTARAHYYRPIDGLAAPWRGRIWLNPPFDSRIVGPWVRRLAEHGDGILLIHARTETRWFRPIWERAEAILFLDRRVNFCRIDGSVQSTNSGAPLVLAAFGLRNARALAESGLGGALVHGWDRAQPRLQVAA